MTVIWNGALLQATGRNPVPRGAVVMLDDVIVAAGPLDDVWVPPEAAWVDAQGGTIMPGVIDAHAHVMANLVAGSDVLTPWLLSGVTTVQDLGVIDGAVKRTRELLASVPARPPRVEFAGPLITTRGGYPTQRPYASIAREVDSAEEARALVADLIENQGVGLIKIAIERGFGVDYDDPGWPTFSPSDVSAITEEAHARGARVAAHLTAPGELEVALHCGVDIIAHMPISLVPDWLLKEAAERGIVVDTTIGVWSVEDPSYCPVVARNAARYCRLGGRLAIGTDYPFAPPAMPLNEFESLATAGVPAAEMVLAATRNGAAAVGKGSERGSLEAGKAADVIVVDGDPLSDWRAMGRVNVVVLGGRIVLGQERVSRRIRPFITTPLLPPDARCGSPSPAAVAACA